MSHNAFWSWIDGLYTNTPQLSFSSGGIQHGYGLFETIYYANGITHALPEHLSRLHHSAYQFRLSPPDIDLAPIIDELIARNHLSEARVKISLHAVGSDYSPHTLPTTLSVSTSPYERKPQSYSLWSAPAAQFGCPLSRHKSTSYASYIMAKQAARLYEADDTLLLNHHGNPIECSSANILLHHQGQWFSPDLSAQGLRGIQLLSITEQCHALSIPLQTADLSLNTPWDAAVICNSLIGAQPVAKIDNRPLNPQIANDLIQQLRF